MKSIGLVVVEVPDANFTGDLDALLDRALIATPSGRVLAVNAPMNSLWEDSVPIEGRIITKVLGIPRNRADNNEWEFFGNVAVRACSLGGTGRTVLHESSIVLLRRAGAKIYERRKTATESVLSVATLPTLHPVFTRDVANNVWHLPVKGFNAGIRRRLGALLAWPDEAILVITDRAQRKYPVLPLDLTQDLVGIPQKRDYEWVTKQPSLFSP